MDLDARVTENLKDIIAVDYTQIAHAYYIDSNPVEMSEEWYMVDAGVGRGYLLTDIHFVAQDNVRDERVKRYGDRFGAEHIRYMGQTYEAEPFFIGCKRYSHVDDAINRATWERLLTRENYADTMAHTAMHNADFLLERGLLGVRLGELRGYFEAELKRLPATDFPILRAQSLKTVANGRVPMLTREQATASAHQFYLNDPAKDAENIQLDAAMDEWIIRLFRKHVPPAP